MNTSRGLAVVNNLREWILSALLAAVCGIAAMGVGKLEKLTQSVVELNQNMALLGYTVSDNRKDIDRNTQHIERLRQDQFRPRP